MLHSIVRHPGWLTFWGAIIGSAYFFLLFSVDVLNVTSDKWLLRHDWIVHYTGWVYFHNEQWQFPLGAILKLDAPAGTTVGFTDSIPILAFIFRAFSDWLPVPFQYFGLWLACCFGLTGVFGILLLRALGAAPLIQVIGSVSYVISPVLVSRIGHPALCAQWIILAALWLYYRERREQQRKQRLFLWVGLVGIAALVNPYLLAMAYLIGIASFARVALIYHTISLSRAISELVILAFLIVVEWWLAGYISVGASAGDLSSGGLGGITLNLLAPFNPKGLSTFIADLPTAQGMRGRVGWNGQKGAEAQAYFGLGVLLLLLIVFLALVWRCRRQPRLVGDDLPIALVAVGATIFASYGSITFGSHIVFEYNLPWVIEKYLSAFRATVRFFWIPYYLLIALALASLNRIFNARIAGTVACCCLMIQVADVLYPASRFVNQMTVWPWQSSFKDRFWEGIGNDYSGIVMVPGFQCADLSTEEGRQWYDSILYLAATHDLALNNAYVGRWDQKRSGALCQDTENAVATGALERGKLYVLDLRHFEQLSSNRSPSVRCTIIDGFNLCWRE